MIKVEHIEYRISSDELKRVFGIVGGINTIEFDYGGMELVIRMIVESSETTPDP